MGWVNPENSIKATLKKSKKWVGLVYWMSMVLKMKDPKIIIMDFGQNKTQTHLPNNINIVIFIFIEKKENTKDFSHKSSLISKIGTKHHFY